MATGTSPSAAPAARMDPHTARRGMFVLKDGRNVALHIPPSHLPLCAVGILQRNDRRDGQAFSGRAALKPRAIGLGAIRALSRLLPDGDACGLAGDEARLQRRDHHWSADDCSGRVLVYSGDAYRAVLGVSDGRLHHRGWAYVSGNDRKSVYDGAWAHRSTPRRASILRNRPTASACSSARSRAGHFSIRRTQQALSTGSERLWIPYAFIGVIVIILAIVFYFAPMPDIEMEDDYHLDDSSPDARRSIWSHPHFWMAVLAQFLYVAAQAGIFSFFINYMTSQVPPVPASWQAHGVSNTGFFSGWIETHPNGALGFSNKAASNLASLGFLCFLIGRFTGSAILKKFAAHKVLGLVLGGGCCPLPCDFREARLGFGGLRFPDLLLHVDHVSDDFRAGDLRSWSIREEGVVIHRHGDHGRGRCCRK